MISTHTLPVKSIWWPYYNQISYEKLIWSWPIWQNCCQETNVKRFQWAKVHKDWTTEQWIKVLWTDKSKFKILGSKRRVYGWRRVGERAAASCITPTVKHGEGSVMVWWTFANCKVDDLHQMKGKIESDWLSIHAVASQSHLECGLWVKDLYSCKIMTQSILVNSARGTLKAKRNSMSFHWCFGWCNQLTNPIELISVAHLWQLLQESWAELSSVYFQSSVERMLRICDSGQRGSLIN